MHPDRNSVSSEIKKRIANEIKYNRGGALVYYLCFCDKLGINASFQLKRPHTVKKGGVTEHLKYTSNNTFAYFFI